VTALNNLIAGFARQLQQIADQGLVGGNAPAPAPAAEAPAEAPAEEAAPAAEGTPEPEAPAEDTSSTESEEN
jgi:large subunit ribosomal protein L10